MESREFDVVVLAGGEGKRLGGADKAALLIGAATLLDRVLAAAAGGRATVVVGAPRPTVREVTWTRESPAGGGPLAGLAAGVAALPVPEDGVPVVVLAVDLPFLLKRHVDRLLTTLAHTRGADVAAYVDDGGRRQLLTAAYRRPALDQALGRIGNTRDAPVRLLRDHLTVEAVPGGGVTRDCDTPEELAAARAALGREA